MCVQYNTCWICILCVHTSCLWNDVRRQRNWEKGMWRQGKKKASANLDPATDKLSLVCKFMCSMFLCCGCMYGGCTSMFWAQFWLFEATSIYTHFCRTLPAAQDVHKWPKNLPRCSIARENGALTRSTYYYEEFTEESKSGFRFTQFHSVSEIRFGKHATVVMANQIAPFRSHAHRLNACDQGNTG